MSRTSWKHHEADTAAVWGAYRIPLSGSNSGRTASDSDHPRIYLETKADAALIRVTAKLLRGVRDRATQGGRRPLLVLYRKGWIHAEDLLVYPLTCFPAVDSLWPNVEEHVEFSVIPAASALLSLFLKTERLAREEEKTPIVAFKKQSFPGGICIFRRRDKDRVLCEYSQRYTTRAALNLSRPARLRRLLPDPPIDPDEIVGDPVQVTT